jgi:AraC-like DNA-binding protein
MTTSRRVEGRRNRSRGAALNGWCVDPQTYRKAAPFVEWTKSPGDRRTAVAALLHEMNLDSTPLGPVFLEYSVLPELDRRGLLLPLDDERFTLRLGNYDPRILDLCAPNGVRVALPDDFDIYGLAYRRDTADAPASWADWLAEARRSRLRHAVAVQQQGPVNRYGFILALLMSNGILPAESDEAMMGDAGCLGECLEWLRTLLMEKGGMNPFLVSHRLMHDAVADFREGLPFWVGWSSKLAPVAARDRSIVFAPFPAGPSRKDPPSLVRGSGWCIPRNTADPQRAVEALLAIQEPAFVRRVEAGGESRKFSAWPALWTHPDLLRRNPFYHDLPGFLRGAPVTVDLTEDRWRVVGESLYQAALGNETVETLGERLRGRVSDRKRTPHAAVRQALNVIDHQWERGLNVRQVSTKAGVHPDHLNRLIRRELNETAGAYLRRRRMERARLLLQTTDQPVKAIALRLGFRTASHFCYAFRRQWGISAGTFRADSSA